MMNNEIKEIVVDNGELIAYYKDGSFQAFDTLLQEVLDYIINLQEENEELKYKNNILKQELEKKKEECSSLIEEINPYQRYGISERDFH